MNDLIRKLIIYSFIFKNTKYIVILLYFQTKLSYNCINCILIFLKIFILILFNFIRNYCWFYFQAQILVIFQYINYDQKFLYEYYYHNLYYQVQVNELVCLVKVNTFLKFLLPKLKYLKLLINLFSIIKITYQK